MAPRNRVLKGDYRMMGIWPHVTFQDVSVLRKLLGYDLQGRAGFENNNLCLPLISVRNESRVPNPHVLVNATVMPCTLRFWVATLKHIPQLPPTQNLDNGTNAMTIRMKVANGPFRRHQPEACCSNWIPRFEDVIRQVGSLLKRSDVT